MQKRETLEVDVLIIGGGPSGLATAIELLKHNDTLQVCVLEKASEIGAHTLSGALIDPRSLHELIPNWQNEGAPLQTEVTSEDFALLTKNARYNLPSWIVPSCLHNHKVYAGSLGALVRWLGEQAQAQGAQIFSGFVAKELLIEKNQVVGVITGDMGIGKDNRPTDRFQSGIEIRAQYTVFAEGCRGHLGQQLEKLYQLRENCDPQSYALGIKELWRIPSEKHRAGHIEHTLGWPLNRHTYGGGFLYHYGDNLVSLGMVIGLDYTNPYCNPYKEMQRWKHHPSIRAVLEDGECIGYGARSLAAGGLSSLPKLTFPGGMLVGCDAGFLHPARIKGVHTAIKSGILAAQAMLEEFAKTSDQSRQVEPQIYIQKFRESWLYSELQPTRNFKPWMRFGVFIGSLGFGVEQLLGGKVPWTLHNSATHTSLVPAKQCKVINYPQADGKISFDLSSSVYLSNTNHDEDQPSHLHLRTPNLAIDHNWAIYASPEQRYCPAGVYEIVDTHTKPKLQIHASNCLHCKACDIKDPQQNIQWMPPQGGEGPIYQNM